MATAVTIAPETRDSVASCTENLSTPTMDTEFRDAGEMRAEFESIDNCLETKALAVTQSIEEVKQTVEEEILPLLAKMQALLSQRGAEHLRREADLPTWTEYYETLRQKLPLKSLRTIQRKLALAPSSSGQGGGGGRKKRPPFSTGQPFCDYIGMLLDLMTQVEKGADIQAIRKTVAEYRKALDAETSNSPTDLTPPAAPTPQSAPVASTPEVQPQPEAETSTAPPEIISPVAAASQASPKKLVAVKKPPRQRMTLVEKGIAREVAEKVATGHGPLTGKLTIQEQTV
jgi:hypothetical protein